MQHLKLQTVFSPHLKCPSVSPHFFYTRPLSSSSHFSPWYGVRSWRQSPVNENRFWGPNGPQQLLPQSTDSEVDASASSLADLGVVVLSTADPLTKARLSHLAFTRWRNHSLPVGVCRAPSPPARPPKPQLLNAIDLAWDTVVRFSPFCDILGEDFFSDFARVADDESRHFGWCSQRLAELGFSYGDMPAHNLLWTECEKSSDNVAARLAVIPLVQEARGLDAGPRLVQKLIGFGDHRTSNIVARIAEEEVAHVAVGVYWFVSVCRKMNRAPCSTFKDLLKEYGVELKGSFNYSARDEAGIPREWYDCQSTNEQEMKEKDNKARQLSEVYDRLTCIISLEKENSSLNEPP